MKLPVLTENIPDISEVETFTGTPATFHSKITVLGFLGSDFDKMEAMAFNLNQKIYKRFYEFSDFQFVMVMPKGTQNLVKDLIDQLSPLTDTRNWKFVFVEKEYAQQLFTSLQTNLNLSEKSTSERVFLIDKEANLRGRKDEEDLLYGYDATSVAELNNVMVDDVKVMLAEYRLALKKNNAYREK